MPRIRTIKPEFCTSEQVVECSTNARLLFVLMWCFCDDAGRHPANIRRIKMECYPGDDFTAKQMESMINELVKAKLLIEYKHEAKSYWQVTGWKHQRIDKPSYKYPPIDAKGIPIAISEDSDSVRRPLQDSSPPEGKGVEGSGKEGSGKDDSSIDEQASTKPPSSEYNFVLCDGTEWNLPEKKIAEYAKTFPELDLPKEFRKAAQWLMDNPKNRKTKTGICGFIGRWLARTQNRGGGDNGRPVQQTFAGQRVSNTNSAIERFVNGTN